MPLRRALQSVAAIIVAGSGCTALAQEGPRFSAFGPTTETFTLSGSISAYAVGPTIVSPGSAGPFSSIAPTPRAGSGAKAPRQAAVLPSDPDLEPGSGHLRGSGKRGRTRAVDTGREELASMIAAKAEQYRVPLALAHAVVQVESNYNPTLIGRGATLGLMQIKHKTAKSMGFTGTAQELMNPATNLEWGMRYLAGAQKLGKGDLCQTVLRYQGGHYATRHTRISTNYCNKVRNILAKSPHPKQVAEAKPR